MAKYRVDVTRGVRVGAHHYPIQVDKAAIAQLQAGSYYGRCFNGGAMGEHRIMVDGSLGATKFSETVVHEVIEAVNCVYCDSKIPHRQICGLANGLTQALDSLGVCFTHRDGKGKV